MPNKQQSNNDAFEYALSWRPDKHDDEEWRKAAVKEFGSANTERCLEGVFTDINEGYNEYGSYPIVTITDDNGESWAWHAMTEVAKTQLVQAEPKIGQRLKITWGGKKISKTPGRDPYTRWRVQNLSVSPEDRAASILGKFGVNPTTAKTAGQFDDDPPF